MHDSKVEQLQERREEIVPQKDMHGKADKEFYITASRILELANKATRILESSKAEQKRQLLQFLLQNSTLDGKRVDFTLKKPFDGILIASKTEDWLACWDDFRTVFLY
jgi:hypothetical protein